MRVAEVMDRPVQVPEDMCIATIAGLFLEGEVSAVVVADQSGETVGIVSERDVAQAAGASELSDALALTPVSRIMRPLAVTVQADQAVQEAVDQMARLDANNVPVLAAGRVVGMLSRNGLRRRSVPAVAESVSAVA